jgi:hypothetical protein
MAPAEEIVSELRGAQQQVQFESQPFSGEPPFERPFDGFPR